MCCLLMLYLNVNNKFVLQEILRHTPEDHQERQNLENAVQKMLEACSDVNEKKREHEEIEKQNLQVKIDIFCRHQLCPHIPDSKIHSFRTTQTNV